MLVTAVADALFMDRRDAGRKLAGELERLREGRPIVLGLPRGGVPVAYEVARALGAPLDVVLVRKLGAPLQPEYGLGAIGEEDVRIVSQTAVDALGVSSDRLEEIVAREREELERRLRLYRGERSPLSVSGRTAILVDDGVATGGTAIAAARVLRTRGAGRVVLAVPVAPPRARERFLGEVDEFICLETPHGFFAVGAYYESFGQVSDEEVRQLLADSAAGPAEEVAVPGAATVPDPPPTVGGIDWSRVEQRSVEIAAGPRRLPGVLRLPPTPTGLVIFAHGSGSSRLSPRNVQVAAALNGAGLATLLFDLLTEEESGDRRKVFDIPLLAERLVAATRWVQGEPDLRMLPLGYFGASTGAAAALCAAAELHGDVRAVVSRGGRPDLAEARLADVSAPTLLIVGGDDWNVLELNDEAAASLHCAKELAIVPHATHLFEEPGALEQVAELAGDWFTEHLVLASTKGATQ